MPLNAALANGLVTVPGYEHLLEAKLNLGNAITEMGINKAIAREQV